MTKCELTNKELGARNTRKTDDGHVIDDKVYKFVMFELGTPCFTLAQAQAVLDQMKEYDALVRNTVYFGFKAFKGLEGKERIDQLLEIQNTQAITHLKKTTQCLTRQEHIDLMKQYKKKPTQWTGQLEQLATYYKSMFYVNSRHTLT